jgi:hypothetical protein
MNFYVNKTPYFLGFEYVLSADGRVCSHVAPIQNTWDNVRLVDKKLVLRDPTNVFFNLTQQPAYYAGQVRFLDI